jgi:hypothetical protein
MLHKRFPWLDVSPLLGPVDEEELHRMAERELDLKTARRVPYDPGTGS